MSDTQTQQGRRLALELPVVSEAVLQRPKSRKNLSGMPSYVTTHNFMKGFGTTNQGEISLQVACDNSCVFCYTAHYPFEPNRQQIMFELMKAKEAGLTWINITGGEPTTRPDFLEILDYANRLKFETIYLKTHGRRFKDLGFAKRVKGKVSFVHVSIHGHNAEVHDLVTRTPGSFDEAIEGIKNLVSLDIPVVGMTVINRLNHRYLAETSKMLFDLGVTSNSFAYPYPSGYALDLFDEIVPFHEEIRESVTELCRYLDETNRHSQIDNIPLCYMQGQERFVNHLWFHSLANSTHEWGPECGQCLYKPLCNGIPGSYIERRGWDEFKPTLEQAPAPWTEPTSMTLDGRLVPVAVGRFLEQPHGGALIGRDVVPLTPEGYRLIQDVAGKVPLAEIEKRFGAYALRFVASVVERKLVALRESSQPHSEGQDSPIPADTMLEYPLYRMHPPYPIVTLT